MHTAFKFIAALLICCQSAFAQDTTQHVVGATTNTPAQQAKPYVILISADGFRYDLADKYHASNLIRLREQGVAADYLQPSFPSLTFPNHYTIVTGLYPSHHGLVDNTFYDGQRNALYSMSNSKTVGDGSWYGGTPLWVLAEKQQMVSASFYWVASESAIQGVRPSYYYIYNEKISIDRRIQAVKDWLQLPEDKRPHLITFYFPEVDHAEHTYGPESRETAAAVQFIDESMAKMTAMVESVHLPVNFIFLADHGMTTVDTVNSIPMPLAIDTSKVFVPSNDALLHLYVKKAPDILPLYDALRAEAKDYDVYLAENMPVRWHYNKNNDRYNRIGDMILVPHLPKVFNINRRRITPGKHGFDPARDDMHAIFFAWGPAFKEHTRIEGFENVHVYPLVAKILGLTYDPASIDGKLEVLEPILKGN